MKRPLMPLLFVTFLIAFMAGCAEAIEVKTQDLSGHSVEPVVELVEENTGEETEAVLDYYPLTEEERELIWQTLYAEARGCDCPNDECLVYVAQCIRDRVLVKGYGSTVKTVITKPSQFVYYRGDASEKLDRRINEAIDIVFKDGHYAFDEPILHFHADDVTPSWADDFELLAHVDGTKYYN